MADIHYEFQDKRFGYRFVNPYNFVPMGSTAPSRSSFSDKGQTEPHFTGRLKCRLITKTPLIIPDTSEGKVASNGHITYPFMRVNGKEIIPASSLRGPIRSVYEAATNSCLGTLKEEQLIRTKSTGNKSMQAGLLMRENGKWVLYRAKKYPVGSDGEKIDMENLSYGACIWFPAGKTKLNKNDIRVTCPGTETGEWKKGYYYRGEPFGSKIHERIFARDEAEKFENIEPQIERLKFIFDYYTEKEIKGAHNNYKRLRDAMEDVGRKFETKDGDSCIPIWYTAKETSESRKNELCYLSPANNGQYAYVNSLNDVVGEYQSCSNRNDGQVCPACRLFGLIGNGGNSFSGRVRFSDAKLESASMTPDSTSSSVHLRELGTPHVSYLSFYTENGKEYDADGVRIRGRKFYWHHMPVESNAHDSCVIPDCAEDKYKSSNRNATVERLDAGNEFTFYVYYDALTQKECEQLKWTLCLGENDQNGRYCHHIGYAKPFGYGSVKIIVEEQTERTVLGKSEQGHSFYNIYPVKEDIRVEECFHDSDERIIGALLKIMDFNALDAASDDEKIKIHYPYVVNRDGKPATDFSNTANEVAAHQWYGQNKKAFKKMTLPDISRNTRKDGMAFAEAMALPALGIKPESGEIKKIFPDKAYGFISHKDGKDIHFDIKSCRKGGCDFDSLKPGDEVCYVMPEQGNHTTKVWCQ